MHLVFADHPMPSRVTHSIFLAGPSPRDKLTHDWRKNALEWLQHEGFQGTVFIPIPEARFHGGDDSESWNYDGQISWECQGRHIADKIVFWVPRDIAGGMPAFTTNIEFGEDLNSGKLVYGRPACAEKCRYMDKRAEFLGIPVHDSLESTLQASLNELGEGDLRERGEVHIPLFIWQTEQFKSWHRSLKRAGNRLESATVLQHFKIPSGRVLSFTLAVNVWIEAEKRFKSNEFIVSRPDISSVVALYKDPLSVGAVPQILLVEEFRSPVNNARGYVLELPGGSAPESDVDPAVCAQKELEEEAGILIEDLSRFELIADTQLNATLSTHRAKVYRVELTHEEFQIAKCIADEGQYLGVGDDTERTRLKIMGADQLGQNDLDLSMIGMIALAIK
jgi:8-oxo-dGTP pyrophosphatase MutT (NUDIX family)